MGIIDDMLGRYGAKLETMTPAEKETFFTMVRAVETKQLTIDRLKQYMRELIGGVERELATTPELEYYLAGLWTKPNRQHIFLKARLSNYLLLEAFLTSPERAKRAFDEAMERVNEKKTITQ
jgi:hypothetical protein